MANRNPFPFELAVWIIGLIFLVSFDPAGSPPPNLCPAKLLGFDFCPGCGLGRSIAWLLHGNLSESVHAHLLGPFAFLVLTHRIFVLGKNSFHSLKGNHHQG
jgi:hypothetical protein